MGNCCDPQCATCGHLRSQHSKISKRCEYCDQSNPSRVCRHCHHTHIGDNPCNQRLDENNDHPANCHCGHPYHYSRCDCRMEDQDETVQIPIYETRRIKKIVPKYRNETRTTTERVERYNNTTERIAEDHVEWETQQYIIYTNRV